MKYFHAQIVPGSALVVTKYNASIQGERKGPNGEDLIDVITQEISQDAGVQLSATFTKDSINLCAIGATKIGDNPTDTINTHLLSDDSMTDEAAVKAIIDAANKYYDGIVELLRASLKIDKSFVVFKEATERPK